MHISSSSADEFTDPEYSSDEGGNDTYDIIKTLKRKGLQKSHSEAQQRKNVNVSIFLILLLLTRQSSQTLARELLHQALHIRHGYEAFARHGVTEADLEKFNQNPTECGPTLRNTKLDKTGISTKAQMNSRWNQTLIYKLATEAKSIASRYNKEFEFGDIDWKKLFEVRMYRIILHDIKSRPREGEQHKDRLLRLAQDHDLMSKKNAQRGVRHLVCLPILALERLIVL